MATIQLYNNSCNNIDLSSDVLHSFTYLVVNNVTPSETQQPQGTVLTDNRLIGKSVQSIGVYAQVYGIGKFDQSLSGLAPGGIITMRADTVEWEEGTMEQPTYIEVQWKYAS